MWGTVRSGRNLRWRRGCASTGPAQIENWNRQDRKRSGRIDELVLLGRAMSDDEVHTLFKEENP